MTESKGMMAEEAKSNLSQAYDLLLSAKFQRHHTPPESCQYCNKLLSDVNSAIQLIVKTKSLLKTDRTQLVKLIDDIDAEIKSLEGTRFAHYGRNKIRAQCLRDWLPRIKQLESKSEMR